MQSFNIKLINSRNNKERMYEKFKVKTNLGDKMIVRANCVDCSQDYFEVLKKGKRKAPEAFLCKECKGR